MGTSVFESIPAARAARQDISTIFLQGDWDFFICIELGCNQSWSNGKVGLLGISYYAINHGMWLLGSLPPGSHDSLEGPQTGTAT